MEVKMDILSNGSVVLSTVEYSVNFNTLFSNSKFLDGYTESTLLEKVILLMSAGITRYGLSLYATGKLDKQASLKKYCNRALVSYADLAAIICPII